MNFIPLSALPPLFQWIVTSRFANVEIMRWLLFRVLLSTAVAQDAPTLSVTTSIVGVDAEVYDTKTGQPIQDLTKADFRVFDDGREVSISALDTGAFAKPIALWLAVICNEKNGGKFGSGGFSGRESLFRQSLNHLQKRDRVAVATWCDDGQASAVLLPTSQHDSAIVALRQALKPLKYVPPPSGQLRTGELAFQAMLRGILRETKESTSPYFPVIIFLHGDWTGAPKIEIDRILSDLLESEGIVYGIKDESVPLFVNHYPGEMGELFHYLAENSGGEYFSVKESEYSKTVSTIIDRVHFRYQLSFRPKRRDGKRHRVTVKLTDSAKNKYKHARIRARREYIPTPVGYTPLLPLVTPLCCQ
jgi:hypothetical protein